MEEALEAGSDATEESPSSSVDDTPARWGWQETHHVAIFSHASLAATLEALEADGDHGDRSNDDYTQMPSNEQLSQMEVRFLCCAL